LLGTSIDHGGGGHWGGSIPSLESEEREMAIEVPSTSSTRKSKTGGNPIKPVFDIGAIEEGDFSGDNFKWALTGGYAPGGGTEVRHITSYYKDLFGPPEASHITLDDSIRGDISQVSFHPALLKFIASLSNADWGVIEESPFLLLQEGLKIEKRESVPLNFSVNSIVTSLSRPSCGVSPCFSF
ncbi:hypothetical protein ACJX0J_014562, partial [Zea mays]